jgi:hypothetical protein
MKRIVLVLTKSIFTPISMKQLKMLETTAFILAFLLYFILIVAWIII